MVAVSPFILLLIRTVGQRPAALGAGQSAEAGQYAFPRLPGMTGIGRS